MRGPALRAALVVVGVLFGLYGYHLLRADLHSPVPDAIASIAVAWAFLFAGIVAWARRPMSRMGVLMVALAFWLLLRKLQYSHESFQFTFGFLFAEVGLTAAYAHAVLAYPTGRLRTSFERAFISAGYVVVVAFSFAQLLFLDPAQKCVWTAAYCAEPPPENLLLVRADNAVYDALHDVYWIGVYGVLAVVFLTLIAQRVRHASPAGRRLLFPMMLGGFVEGTYGVWRAAHVFTEGGGVSSGLLYWWQICGQLAVAIALLVGLLRSELARGTVADLVVELSHVPPGEVRDAMARALHDDTLRVAYWLPMRRMYVDGTGRPVELPQDGRAVTKLDDIAAIVHDPELDPQLVEAAGAAARLALHNARLQADVSAQLAKVQESRRRIVTAGDEERRRIERNLHDGAQQRLVALALELRIAQRQFGAADPQLEAVLAGAVSELQVAVEELRELARGLHPAVLSEEGLGGALESLAARTPLPVRIVSTPDGRLPEEIEAAAYFVACEAIANTVKHAHATRIEVSADRLNGRLVIEVQDDGVGGAHANGGGSGLRGLLDRVEAHGGTLRIESEPGSGTRVIGELPCAS
jgi:signal transduction histidine kinase